MKVARALNVEITQSHVVAKTRHFLRSQHSTACLVTPLLLALALCDHRSSGDWGRRFVCPRCMRTAPRQPPRTVASHSPTRAAQLRARLSGSMRHVRRLRLQPLMQAVATPTRKAATAPAVLAPSTQRTLSPGEGAVTSRFASGLPEGVVAEAATLSPTRPAESAVILVAEHVSEAGRAPEAAPDPQEASPRFALSRGVDLALPPC